MLKTIFFASLIAMMILPFNDMSIAEAEKTTNTIYDPNVVKYIKKVIAQTEKIVEEKTIDGQFIKATTKVKQLDDDTYKVRIIVKTDGVKTLSSGTKITVIDDSTYKIVNKKQGIKQTFTDVSQGATSTSTGHSDSTGANINLYDREYGTPNTLRLHDNYSGCGIINQADLKVNISSSVVDVNWKAHPFYAHWCFIPHQFESGEIQYGTDVYRIDGQTERNGYHVFTNTHSGTTWYSVSADFVYGAW